jgi:hypothetical protein
MNTLLRNVIFAAFGLFLVQGSAFAGQWSNAHGTNTVIEYPGNTINSAGGSASVYYKGWGLDFVQKANTQNWVHNWIPNQSLQQVSTIYVRYYKQYAGATIDLVHVYNGDTLIKVVAVPQNNFAGWITFSVSLGGFLSAPNGIGVSLHVVPAAGANTQFIVSDVSGYVQ